MTKTTRGGGRPENKGQKVLGRMVVILSGEFSSGEGKIPSR